MGNQSWKIMPYANNEGVQIHYEVEGNGPPLVLLHGLNLAGSESFRANGYVEPLKEKYQLILIDVRGHGASDKPHKPEAYRAKTLAADIVAVLDQLKVRKAHFLGYSLGGLIGFALAKYAPERFHSMIIGGAHPYKPNAEEKAELESIIQRYKKGKDAVIAEAEKRLGKKMNPTYKAQAMAADTEALVALARALLLSSEDQTSSFEEVLPTMSMPCLIYVGEKDTSYSGARKCAESMPNATFVSLPNLDHGGAWAQSSIILPYIIKFLDKLSRTRALIGKVLSQNPKPQ
jgi:pimeloyl-ACP methyl ester carboxylesterase